MSGRKMQPRAVVFNLYGEYIRHRGGEASVVSLQSLLEPFRISETALRVTLSRMSREGWLTARRAGRKSFYSLTAKGVRMLDEGHSRVSRYDEESSRPWDGAWFLLVYSIAEERKNVRDLLRKELTWLGFGSLAAATWISPRDRSAELEELKTTYGLDQQLLTLRARSVAIEQDRALVARGWPLPRIAGTYRAIVTRYRSLMDRLEKGKLPEPDECYRERTVMTYDYRRLPFIDPQLPAMLLPTDWPGHEARRIFTECTAILGPPAFAFADEVLTRGGK